MRLALGVALLVVLMAVIWYQARGLEERVLGAIQPHLMTDVKVGSVELTVWDSWPNVEVVLGNVRIEDAVEEGGAFVELNALGVVFAWQPLLFGRLEVAELQAEGGRINVHRYRDGRENWQFWKPGDGADSGVDWTVESVVLKGVQLDGEWWSEGVADPVAWSVLCRSASLALEQGGDAGWTVDGAAGMQGAELDASGQRWLDEVDLDTKMNLRVGGGDLRVSLTEAEARNNQGALDFGAVLGNDGGFSLALLCEGADGNALLSLVPPGLKNRIEELPSISGAADVEVLVGTGRLPNGWGGPQDRAWSEAWAVRVAPQSLALRWKGLPAQFSGGTVVAYPKDGGWSLSYQNVLGQAADGEFRCSGTWSSSDGVDSVALQGEMVARPEGVLPWLGEDGLLPQGWRLKTGGVVRAQFDVAASQRLNQPWAWSRGKVTATASDVGFIVGSDGSPNQVELDIGAVEVDASPKAWEVAFREAAGLGTAGDVVVRHSSGAGTVDIEASISKCDVKELLAGAANIKPTGSQTASNAPLLQWSVDAEQLTWGALSLRSIGAEGSYSLEEKKGVLGAVSARAFDGRILVRGEWNSQVLALQGSVVDVEISSFLEGTEGLGQSTLLPSHVRGRAWAEGTLDHHFGKAANLAWETDLTVRIEQGELLDFGLLQRIPETLKTQGKYRFISDAEDLSKRLMRVRFEPLEAQVSLSRGVFTLEPAEVVSDAMNVGIAGWQRLSGGMDYTLDFALRDLKSDKEEFGTTADDGLGHRFFLAIGGTLEEPEFGYDRSAHKRHRQDGRRSALGRLRGLILGEEEVPNPELEPELETAAKDSVLVGKSPKAPSVLDFEDDEDDYSP